MSMRTTVPMLLLTVLMGTLIGLLLEGPRGERQTPEIKAMTVRQDLIEHRINGANYYRAELYAWWPGPRYYCLVTQNALFAVRHGETLNFEIGEGTADRPGFACFEDNEVVVNYLIENRTP